MKIGKFDSSKINFGYEARLTIAMLAIGYIGQDASDRFLPKSERADFGDVVLGIFGYWFIQWIFFLFFGVITTMFHKVFTGTDREIQHRPLELQFYSTVAAFIFAAGYWCKAYKVF